MNEKWTNLNTDKYLSEALIFASTNPQYGNVLFIELQVQFMKIPSSNLGEHVVYKNCSECQKQFLYPTHVHPRFELGIFMN